jgi:DNA-binding NarL/FixJ family response regulator
MKSEIPGTRPLTSRQLEVLKLMAQGHSNQAISQMLFISEKAVVQHTSQIYARFDLHANHDDHRRVKAVLRYLGG